MAIIINWKLTSLDELLEKEYDDWGNKAEEEEKREGVNERGTCRSGVIKLAVISWTFDGRSVIKTASSERINNSGSPVPFAHKRDSICHPSCKVYILLVLLSIGFVPLNYLRLRAPIKRRRGKFFFALGRWCSSHNLVRRRSIYFYLMPCTALLWTGTQARIKRYRITYYEKFFWYDRYLLCNEFSIQLLFDLQRFSDIHCRWCSIFWNLIYRLFLDAKT